ncbi:hypothetical protein FEE95_08490 [Maribacter algarum]|uniref:Nuclear transport factor 2 family protein n=1 Tax=Maribacter algarum (ex Zhang et al. 2020) TaxID=2578118 RepID=A0A5S3PWQ4_9FLAO|nr:nuclear transport factor 2 family protein [Maribacter algarum]TMM59449.1 hypothetical protein FEE95_08490 [Maribacter algarum]
MNHNQRLFTILFVAIISANCIAQDSKQEVLNVVNTFFKTMQEKDSIAFNNLFLKNAYAYSIRGQGDSARVKSSILKASNSENILEERLSEEEITIHVNKNVAAVWAPYDFWIDDKHSHCGYEVFTLIKKKAGWKIASLTYSVEQDTCNK